MKNPKLVVFLMMMLSVLLCSCGSKVEEITVKGADGTGYTSYRTACSNGDFDAAREYIEKMKEQLTKAKATNDAELSKALESSIAEAERYILDEELQYLASLNDEQANNRIILILNQQVVKGYETPDGSCLGKDVSEDMIKYGHVKEIKSFKEYIKWCGAYNTKCNIMLDIAIACNNESLAKKLLVLIRKDPDLLKKNERKYHDGGAVYFDVYAHYTTTSRDAAQKKYDEAVKNGAFN